MTKYFLADESLNNLIDENLNLLYFEDAVMAGYGMQSHVGINFQDSYGTSQTTSLQYIPFTTEGITHTIEQLTEANMYSRFSESPYHAGAHLVQGDLTLDAQPTTIGHFLKSVVGLTSTTSDTGKQIHIFNPATEDFGARAAMTPMTMELFRDVGSSMLYYDLIGNNISLNIANGQLLNMTCGFIGAGVSRVANSTPTFPTDAPFLWDQVSATYNGATVVDLRDLTININNNLEAVYTLTGSKTPYKIKRTAPQQIEITGTMLYQSHSYQQAFEAQAENQFILNFVNAQSPHTLKIDMPSMRFKTFEPVAGGQGIVEASFTAGAMFNANSNDTMKITLENTHTYY